MTATRRWPLRLIAAAAAFALVAAACGGDDDNGSGAQTGGDSELTGEIVRIRPALEALGLGAEQRVEVVEVEAGHGVVLGRRQHGDPVDADL